MERILDDESYIVFSKCRIKCYKKAEEFLKIFLGAQQLSQTFADFNIACDPEGAFFSKRKTSQTELKEDDELPQSRYTNDQNNIDREYAAIDDPNQSSLGTRVNKVLTEAVDFDADADGQHDIGRLSDDGQHDIGRLPDDYEIGFVFDQNRVLGKVFSREVRKPSNFLHLKFNEVEINKVLTVSDLLQQYCAEETVELKEDLDSFHSLYQHKDLPCDCSTRKRIELNFSTSKLVLLHISFVIDTGLLTTNKISIIASLFIEDSFHKKFALVGFVVHKGILDSGHYIAYVVDADHNPLQWVSFDDLEGVSVVFKPSSFFENITADTSSHVCLLIYGEISNELSNFHAELKTEGNLNIHKYF